MRLKPKFLMLLIVPVLLLASCSPIRRTQRNRQVDSTAVDRSEIRKTIHDLLRESGTLTQTVVEFYPPTPSPSVAVPNRGKHAMCFVPPDSKSSLSARLSMQGMKEGDGIALSPEANCAPLPAHRQSQTPPPAVKRIIHTEIVAERERETTTDSTTHNDISTEVQSELSDKVAEKPPAATATIKWIAIALAAIAVIILLLKFPKIKLPRF